MERVEGNSEIGKVTDKLYDIYVTEETNCAESMFRASVGSRRDVVPDDCQRMMSGFSGGVSSKNFCGAILGGVAGISYLINEGDEESFERSKGATEKFVVRCKEDIGTLNCHEIKETWRKEDIRCYDIVKKMAENLEEVLQEFEKGKTE